MTVDVLLFGATGVVGERAARYLAVRASELGCSWGVAGRRAEPLKRLAASLPADHVPEVIVADLARPETIVEMVAATRVVINAVGPFRRTQPTLSDVCVAQHVDLVDLVGEEDLGRRELDERHERARSQGVRIVAPCGYESLPFDLAVATLEHRARGDGDEVAAVDVIVELSMPVRLPQPTRIVSGGTWRSLCDALEGDLPYDPAALLPLSADAEAVRRANLLRLRPRYDRRYGLVVPVLPSPFANPPVIQRTIALAVEDGARSATALSYREGQIVAETGLLGQSAVAVPFLAGLGLLGAVGAVRPRWLRRSAVRWLRAHGPAPGTAPSEDEMDRWSWRVHLDVKTAGGRRLRTLVEGDGHPGYVSTPPMLAEAGLLLADTTASLPHATGWLTPSAALGVSELERFRQAGMRFGGVVEGRYRP